MSGTAKGMIQIATSLSEAKVGYLRARAEALDNSSNSKVLAKIVDFWIALGAPALSELDAARPTIPVPANIRVPLIPAWVKYAGKHPPASLPVRG